MSTFNLEEQNQFFFSTDFKLENFNPSESRIGNMSAEGVLAPLNAQSQGRAGSDMLHMLAQQEPHLADTAPASVEVDLMNYRVNTSEALYGDDNNNSRNFYMGGSNRSESAESTPSNMWGDANPTAPRNGEMLDTFDFLVKSISSANTYVSMLTREQLSVLRAIRPSLLYEFLQEVAKVRGEKRMRRALPHECAFCKNNGENEECYTSHPLKDWRGRVLCPVLRAFRCPRCGSTGDRAHTIKYCPENADNNVPERSSGGGRRHGYSGVGGGAHAQPPTPTPASSPSVRNNLWNPFGMN